MLDYLKRAWRDLFGPKPEPMTREEAQRHLNQMYSRNLHNAIAAQKNLRLHSIARERSRLKDEIARRKRNKKRHLHLSAELRRLTALELQIEGGKA